MNHNKLTHVQAAAREAAHAYNDRDYATVNRIAEAVYDTLSEEEKIVYSLAYVRARMEG